MQSRLPGQAGRGIAALAAFFLTFSAGIAVMTFQVFPYAQVQWLLMGWDALRKLEPDRLPTNALYVYPDPQPILPARILDPRAGVEKRLIAGGFWQNMDVCPEFGCVAWVTDRDGKIGHVWQTDPAPIVAALKVTEGDVTDMSIYVTGLAPTPDGGLVVTLQGRNTFPYQVGLARIAFDGTLEWVRNDASHHWPTVDRDGTIIAPIARHVPAEDYVGRTLIERKCPGGLVDSQGVRVIAPDGTVRAEFWIDDVVAAAGLSSLFYAVKDSCNPHHVNGTQIVTPAAARRMPGAKAGDLAVSLRETSSVLILDRETGALRHVIRGAFAAQHSPVFLADGQLAVFDNRAGDRSFGGSRVVAIDPATGTGRTIFPTGDEGDAVLPFKSDEAGILSQSADGTRMLISETRKGRVIEIDIASSTPLWVYEKTLNIAPFLERRGRTERGTTARFSTQGAYFMDPSNPAAEG